MLTRSSKLSQNVWTYVIVTSVTFLIWYWAAGETQDSGSITLTVRFTVPDGWLVEPARQDVSILVKGSTRAIRKAKEQITSVEVPIIPSGFQNPLDLAGRLREQREFSDIGVSVESAEPSPLQLGLDQLVTEEAAALPDFPVGVDIEERVVEPPLVKVTLPSTVRAGAEEDLIVRAVIDARDLENLQPGVRHTLENVRLRPSGALPSDGSVRMQPDRVTVLFTIRSQLRQVRLPSVQVQILSPEAPEYLVELDPKQLRDVVITAPTKLAQQIESGEAVVIAVVQLRLTEIEQKTKSKAVSTFLAITPNGNGVPVAATLGDASISSDPPRVNLTITERP